MLNAASYPREMEQMKWFNNLKISLKIITGFGIILSMVLFLTGYTVITLQAVDNAYGFLDEIVAQEESINIQANAIHTLIRQSNDNLILTAVIILSEPTARSKTN